jgi:hypothetical protein
MSSKVLLRSFAGGEIAPELLSRVDLTKYQTGLQQCLNFIVLPHGPVTSRAGWKYLIETKDSTKKSVLIPFIFSATQTYILEFGDAYVRFHSNGGTVLETGKTVSAISKANPGVITSTSHGFSNGDWVYVSGIGGMVELNGRFVKVANKTANTFQIQDIHGGANVDTTGYTAYTSGGTVARVYEIASPYAEADLFDLHYTQSADVLTVVHPSYQQRELRRSGATDWAFATISFTPTQAAPTNVTGTATASGSTDIDYFYVATAIAADGLEESLASAPTAAVRNTLTEQGHYNTINWTAASGATRYNVYKKLNGLFGYIGQASGTSFVDDNITPDTSKTPPEANDPFVGAGNYPGAVGYFEGRRWFAGTANKPQNAWATRAGTEKNMSYSIPTRDDDSIAVRLTARQANTIRHIVPLADLLLLTSGAEWKITAQNSDAITPTTISYRPEDYIGASNVPPVVTSGAVLYAQDRGGRIREMKYTWESQGYRPADISIMAPHLFDGYSIKAMAYTRAPYSAMWAVRSDGVLLGLTYVPEHEVAAWHTHTTDGEFESIASVPEGTEDVLYAVVKRTVNNRTVRYLERLNTRKFDTLADSFFVDSGLTYSGTAATKISGLWHLVGKEVQILADGAVQPTQTVSASGSVTLEQASSKVHIGLGYNADIETLPLAFETQAFAQALRKNINKVHLRVHRSSGVFVGPSFDRLTEAKQRTGENYGTPPAFVTGVIPLTILPSWNNDGTICVRQSNPLPLTILGLVPETA